MRCYLCNAETADRAMQSGVVVCLACRRREDLWLMFESPQSAEKAGALFGDSAPVAKMYADLDFGPPPARSPWGDATFAKIVGVDVQQKPVHSERVTADYQVRQGDHIVVNVDGAVSVIHRHVVAWTEE
ncbi:MAG: hypothetical protein PVS2B1_17040 [Candidatus Dormibacteraceae bacterium]